MILRVQYWTAGRDSDASGGVNIPGAMAFASSVWGLLTDIAEFSGLFNDDNGC